MVCEPSGRSHGSLTHSFLSVLPCMCHPAGALHCHIAFRWCAGQSSWGHSRPQHSICIASPCSLNCTHKHGLQSFILVYSSPFFFLLSPSLLGSGSFECRAGWSTDSEPRRESHVVSATSCSHASGHLTALLIDAIGWPAPELAFILLACWVSVAFCGGASSHF